MNKLFELDFYLDNLKLLGIIAIIVGGGAWLMDIVGFVYKCPFCRAQRTVILVLGIFMMLPSTKHFILRYITCILGLYGAGVAAAQHFRGWARIQMGEFTWYDPWYMEAFMLSFFAFCIIIAQVWLIFLNKK